MSLWHFRLNRRESGEPEFSHCFSMSQIFIIHTVELFLFNRQIMIQSLKFTFHFQQFPLTGSNLSRKFRLLLNQLFQVVFHQTIVYGFECLCESHDFFVVRINTTLEQVFLFIQFFQTKWQSLVFIVCVCNLGWVILTREFLDKSLNRLDFIRRNHIQLFK